MKQILSKNLFKLEAQMDLENIQWMKNSMFQNWNSSKSRLGKNVHYNNDLSFDALRKYRYKVCINQELWINSLLRFLFNK